MKRFTIIFNIIIIVFTISFTACGKKPSSVSQVKYEKITAQEAKDAMDKDEVIILDVRTVEEFQEGHIEKAILIPDTEIKKESPTILTDKNANILVYCRSGRRSALASKDLISMGYTNVFDFGGIIDWPYDIVQE